MKISKPKLSSERTALVRAILDILKLASSAYLGHDKLGDSGSDLIVGMAIIIGHADGKPMTATDISNYIGMPRTTVLRRLNLLIANNIVEVIDDRGRLCFVLTKINDPKVLDNFLHIARKAIASADVLSKMDGKAIDE